MSAFICRGAKSRIPWCKSWVIILKREILQCQRFQKVCSYKCTLQANGVGHVEETINCTVAWEFGITYLNTYEETERIIKLCQLHMTNLSEGSNMDSTKMYSLTKWKACPIAILIMVFFPPWNFKILRVGCLISR